MDAVLTALVEDRIGPGDQGRLLVQFAREKLEFDYCLALRSPAVALFTALKSLGLEEGQGVIISALSPLYYQNVLDDLKLKAVYADVHPGTPNISHETAKKALESVSAGTDVKAVILHHTLGYIPDSASICGLGLPLIEDCSLSYGLRNPVKNSAAIPANNIVLSILGLEERDMLTAGGGALLFAGSRRDAAGLRSFGNLPPEYGLPDMNAAMGLAQFRGAVKNLARRQEIAAVYKKAAAGSRHKCFVQESGNSGTADDSEQEESEYNNYAFSLILESGMKEVKAYAKRREIIVESAFENTPAGTGIVPSEKCPQAWSLSLRTVLFPLYPRLHSEEVEKVSRLISTLP